MRSRLAALVVGAAVVAWMAAPTSAQANGESRIMSGPGGHLSFYTQHVTLVIEGDEVHFTNYDPIGFHDVVTHYHGPDDSPWCFIDPDDPSKGRQYRRGHCPAFWSRVIGFGSTTRVYGIENLTALTQPPIAPQNPRVYEFHCSLHHNMTGQLVVLPRG